jgi:Mg2+ and Co2+ transporter CorA
MSELTREAGAPRSRRLDARLEADAASPVDTDGSGGGPDAREAGAVTIRLFDADRTDATLELDDALKRKVGDRQLLWIDVEGEPDRATSEAIGERLGLRPITRGMLAKAPQEAHVALHGEYLHIRVATEADRDPSEAPGWLDLIAAGNVVASWHAEPVAILSDIDDRIEADATIGQLDAAAFVASAVDAVVTSYFKSVDEIEAVVDRLDAVALGGDPEHDVLADLVEVRRRISRLRRVLSGQREVFAAFATPDFRTVVGDDAEAFAGVASRYEGALQSVENSRDLLLGSFEVFMTRTAQKTNDTMKVLALATVLLLPGSLIAGLLGMNVTVPLNQDNPMSFWFVVVAIAVLAAVVLGFARARRWI